MNVRDSAGRGPSSRTVRRLAAFTAGCILVSFGIAAMILADFGTSPYDAMNVGLGARLGVGPGTAMWLTATVVLAAAWLLGGRPGVGTLAAFLAVGQLINIAVAAVQPPTELLSRAALVPPALIALCAGICLVVVARFGAGHIEVLMLALVGHGWSIRMSRLVMEAAFVAAAAALGGPVGVMTVVLVLFTGPALAVMMPYALRLVGAEDAPVA